MRSDSDIKRDVEEELKWEPNVDATDIAVAVKNGVVTLTGYVRSYAHKLAAERAAKSVAGVVGLANDLEVRLPGADERPDPEIAREVAAELPLLFTAHQTGCQKRLGDARRRGRVELPARLCGAGYPLDQGCQGG